MYSVVLMAALTAGGNTADLGRHHHGCNECSSCSSGCSSCGYSSGCSTCGYSHTGCSTCGYAPTGCSTCGYSSVGCSTCANGVCPTTVADAGTKATIVVTLPADAKLTIDDVATTSTSDHRVFVTPELPSGKDFHYTLKAEVSVNGKAQVVSQVVTVRAGEASRVTLTAPTGVAAR